MPCQESASGWCASVDASNHILRHEWANRMGNIPHIAVGDIRKSRPGRASEETEPDGGGGGGPARGDAEFAEDRLDVFGGGAAGDEEGIGDLAIGQSFDDQTEDF